MTAGVAPAAQGAKVLKYAKQTMKPGDRGPAVRALQFYLTKISIPPVVDGIYGPGTRHSVKAFEVVNSLPRDGVVQRGQARRIRTAAKRARVAPTGPFVFPVAGPHSFGSSGNNFGAPRSGHSHQGQDVMAACGVPIVAAQGGSVRVNKYQASGAGHYVVIRGAVNGEDYMYAHFPTPSPIPVGATVRAGSVIGSVGRTGSATACHLHFEMWTVPGWYLGGHPYDPLPALLAWDAYS
jgi:murein DD-endopeptidase MepM/ murein hydrolase activator NlpD